MSARIVNQLRPEEATLCASLADAQATLARMLEERKARGWTVRQIELAGGPASEVFDERGRPEGIYYIEDG